MPNEVTLKDVKESFDKLDKNMAEARTEFEGKLKAVKDEQSGEVKDLVAKASEDLIKRFDEMDEKQKLLNAALNRKNFENRDDSVKALQFKEGQKLKAWMKDHAQNGNESADVNAILGKDLLQESKDLTVGDDPQAGFSVRPQIESMIDATVTEMSVFRQHARVVTLSNSDHIERLINKKGGVGATRGGNERTAPENTGAPSLGEDKIFAHFMDADVPVSQQLLDDASFDMAAWINGEATEDFNVREDEESFIGGLTGRVNKHLEMRGILTYAAGTSYGQVEQVGSGSAGAFTTDGILDLVGSMKESYQSGARFFAQRQTIFSNLFTLKDAEDRYYLVPDFSASAMFRLLGFPINMAPYMPVAASGSLSLAFVNLGRAYTIVDRSGLQLMRDPYTEYPMVKFRFRKRTGGAVEVFEAVKLQVLT